MVPLKAVGVDLDIVAGRGPVIAHPVRGPGDLEQIRPLAPSDLWYVTEAVGLLVAELGRRPADRLRRARRSPWPATWWRAARARTTRGPSR